MIVAGNGIYEQCGYCQRPIKVSGFFGGLHICLHEKDRALIDNQRRELGRLQQQQQTIDPSTLELLRKINNAPKAHYKLEDK